MIDNSWCGWGSCFHPSWMQKFNRPGWYLLVFGLYGWIQCMAGFYFTSTIPTIEKRFKLPSKITGIIMSGNDVSIVMLSLTLSYYGSKRNRPVLMGVGGVITAMSCFLVALPHFIYGPGQDALALTKEFWDQEYDNLTVSQIKEDTSLCMKGRHREVCTDDDLAGEFSFLLVAILFFSQFVLGIGWTLFQTLGQTYLDDNTDKKKTPFMISIASSLRQMGPALGSYLTSACLKLYIDLSVTPVIDIKDPRWIGAWWLGWVIIGFILLIISIGISMFPKEILSKKQKRVKMTHLVEIKPKQLKNPSEENPLNRCENTLKILAPAEVSGFLSTLKRITKNKILFYNYLSTICTMLYGSGMASFNFKYMEAQFNIPVPVIASTLALPYLISIVSGLIISGFVLSKFKPGAKYVLGYNVFEGLFAIAFIIFLQSIRCPSGNFQDLDWTSKNVSITTDCNSLCDCGDTKFEPVCFKPENITYYSPCHAGCTSETVRDSSKIYSGCSCVNTTNLPEGENNTIVSGVCATDCYKEFITYAIAHIVYQFIYGLGRIGNLLITFRIVLKKDKDFAQGLGLVLYSLLGQIPGPIIFGVVIDSTCLVWDRSCGAKGNCWLYNKDSFRIRFFSLLAVFCLFSSLLDMKVWHLGKNVDMYKDYDENKYIRKEKKRSREKNIYMREEDKDMREEAKDMSEEDKDMREGMFQKEDN